MTGYPTQWPPARAKRAIELFYEGLSSAKIAQRLSEEEGRPVNKNQVLGMLYRRGLSADLLSPASDHPDPPSQYERLRFDRVEVSMRGGCRWVLGEVPGPDWRWCGKPRVTRSWCAEHAARCER